MKRILIITTVLIWFSTSCNKKKYCDIKTDLHSKTKGDISAFDGNYMLGVAYYPEQWDSTRWKSDFEKMKSIGINTVRMGEFAWSRFEPQKGKFEFAWMDNAIQIAAKYNIKTVLCTPTASIVPWLVKEHPEVLTGDAEGSFDQGVRKGHNTNNQDLIKANDRIVKAMAKHFGNNPNVIGWQLDNEPGYPFTMHDEISEQAFRIWLKNKYKTLDSLNKAWVGELWSLEYTSWDEINLPPLNRADGGSNPGQQIDCRRFFSDSFLSYLKRQEEILRQYIGKRFIFTNWPNTFWSMDIFKASEMLDFNGWDNYSAHPGVADFRELYGAGIHHDLCRSSNPSKIFIISEQPTQAPACASPKGVWLRTMIDLAHGAYGTLFFEWCPPLGGAEQGYASALQLDGSFGPSLNVLTKLGIELPKLAEALKGSRTLSDVALLYSYDNQWVQGWWMGNNKSAYDNIAYDYYVGLKSMKRNIDIVSENHQLDGYKIIAAPALQMISDSLAKRLIQYVKDGGSLIINQRTGTKDIFNRYRELPSPGVFAEAAGIKVHWVENYITGKNIKNFKVELENQMYEPASYMDLIQLNGAEVLATFSGGELNGKPAITISKYGKGNILYMGTDATSPLLYEQTFNLLAKRLKFESLINVPLDVEVTSRQTSTEVFYFIINLTDTIREIQLKDSFIEVLSGKKISGHIELPGLDAIVLKKGL